MRFHVKTPIFYYSFLAISKLFPQEVATANREHPF